MRIDRSTDIGRALRRRQRGFIIDPYAFGVAADPSFADVKLLMHGEGSDGGTTLTDSSSIGHTFGSISGVTTETERSRYGSASLLAASNAATAKIASTTAFALVAAWTMEFSAYFDSALIWSSGVTRYALARNNSIYFQFQRVSSTINVSAVGVGNVLNIACGLDTWYDLAFVRESGGGVHAYLDGTRTSTGTDSSGFTPDAGARAFSLYNVDTGGFFLAAHGAYFDEIRYTTAARYTGSTYTLAGGPFPDS